jgi:hypothetical protein
MQTNGSHSHNLFWQLVQPVFLLSLGMLLFTAFGIPQAMAFLSEKFQKLPIELRKPLDTFAASRMPSFASGYTFKKPLLGKDDFGTDRYLYLDLIPDHPHGVSLARLFVTYYSNQKDKVPHTPEVCLRQSGAVIKQVSTITVETPELAPAHPQIEACFVKASLKTGDEVIIYCFYVEGKFCSTRNQARLVLGIPGNKHTYFSKIETSAHVDNDSDLSEAIAICKKVLQESLLLLVNEHFPATEQLNRN